MSSELSQRQVTKVFLQVSLLIAVVEFIFLVLAPTEFWSAILLSVMGFIMVFGIGMGNVFAIKKVSAYFKKSGKTEKKQIKYIVSLVITPIIYFVILTAFSPFLFDPEPNKSRTGILPIMLISSWLISSLMIIIYNNMAYYNSKTQAEIENLKLKSIISDTANQLLKQQIQPHFLFNVLNTIKSLYKKDINQGETYLVHLAGFLRASISDPAAKIVTVEEELQLCQDYIEMQRLRFGGALYYLVTISAETRSEKYLPFFAIQILLENAIKHNDLTEDSPLTISVTELDGYIIVKNCIQKRNFQEASTGLGLFNLAERYRLISGDEIEINNKDGEFSVKLKALTNEHSNHRG